MDWEKGRESDNVVEDEGGGGGWSGGGGGGFQFGGFHIGAGGLPFPGNSEFGSQPGIFLGSRGCPFDLGVVRGKTGFESLLQLGNQLVEIGHGVRGMRGHSLKSNLSTAAGGRALSK